MEKSSKHQKKEIKIYLKKYKSSLKILTANLNQMYFMLKSIEHEKYQVKKMTGSLTQETINLTNHNPDKIYLQIMNWNWIISNLIFKKQLRMTHINKILEVK